MTTPALRALERFQPLGQRLWGVSPGILSPSAGQAPEGRQNITGSASQAFFRPAGAPLAAEGFWTQGSRPLYARLDAEFYFLAAEGVWTQGSRPGLNSFGPAGLLLSVPNCRHR